MKYLILIISLPLFTSCKTLVSNKNYLTINGHKLSIEVADTSKKRELGLMNRTELPANTGMLFVFANTSILNFWMKNTLIPLSIAYIDDKCTIVDIQDMQPAAKNAPNPKTYPSEKPARYALETNIGWFKKHKIKVGDKVIAKLAKTKVCAL